MRRDPTNTIVPPPELSPAQADPLSILRVILGQMHNATSLDDLLERTVGAIHQILPTSVSAIMQLLPSQRGIYARAFLSTKPYMGPEGPLPTEGGLVGAAVQSQQTIAVQDTLADPRFRVVPGWDTRAELFVPIVTRQGMWGMLNCQSEQVGAFPPTIVDVLEIVAKQLAIAVENADLVEQSREQARLLERRARELTQVLRLNNQLSISTDIDTLLDQLARAIRDVLGFRVVVVNLVDAAQNRVWVASTVGCTPAEEAILRGATYNWDEFFGPTPEQFRVSHSYFFPQEAHYITQGVWISSNLDERSADEWQADDILLIPIASYSGEILGVFSVDDPIDRQRPSLATIQGLEIFALQAAAAIENARLYAQAQAALEALQEAHQQQADLLDQFRLTQAELLSASKLAAVGTLAAGVAHEFNNLLAGMHGYAELGQGGSDAEKNEALEIIQRTCQRGVQITRRLLTFARQSEGARELAEISELAEGAIQLISWDLARAGLTVVRDYQSNDYVMVESGQLMQVVLNLLANARDATPAGGTITVGTRAAGDWVEITVRDTGSGIPEAIRPRIFEPFVTTKGALGGSAVAGTGLGLSVSYGIVQAHGGRLLVESELGVGSLFTVVLARATVTGEPAPAAAPAIATPARQRILVVDDEPHVRAALARLLTRAGHQVDQASDGDEAVTRSAHEHWDVIISDVTMPTLDGPGMIAKLRAAGQLTPVVLMTGRVDSAAMALAQGSSAAVVLEKPFDQRALLDAIARACEQAQ